MNIPSVLEFRKVAKRGKSVHIVNDYALYRGKSAHLTAAIAGKLGQSVHQTAFIASRHDIVS